MSDKEGLPIRPIIICTFDHNRKASLSSMFTQSQQPRRTVVQVQICQLCSFRVAAPDCVKTLSENKKPLMNTKTTNN